MRRGESAPGNFGPMDGLLIGAFALGDQLLQRGDERASVNMKWVVGGDVNGVNPGKRVGIRLASTILTNLSVSARTTADRRL